MGFFYTIGRYRSVAVAWLLEEVFKLMSADRITVQYLAREAGEWSHLCIASVKIAERTIRQSKS